MYFTEKNLTRFNNISYTYFLNPSQINKIKSKIKDNNCLIYYPYKDSEKNILYRGDIPQVILYEIKSKISLRHQDILGTLYSLNIADDLFGDILIINNHYYIYILPILRNYLESNFTSLKNSRIELEEIDVDILSDYKRSYEDIEIIVSSNRIDTVVSAIIHSGRNNISNLVKKKEIILNYEYLKKTDYKLRENDVFSIKRVGKFKYVGIIKNTKSNHYIIKLFKYI